jgi:hypothetical protein
MTSRKNDILSELEDMRHLLHQPHKHYILIDMLCMCRHKLRLLIRYEPNAISILIHSKHIDIYDSKRVTLLSQHRGIARVLLQPLGFSPSLNFSLYLATKLPETQWVHRFIQHHVSNYRIVIEQHAIPDLVGALHIHAGPYDDFHSLYTCLCSLPPGTFQPSNTLSLLSTRAKQSSSTNAT